MLNLKSYLDARKDFEKMVTDTITIAQAEGRSTVSFERLPQSVQDDLRAFGYPIAYAQERCIVTVL